MRSVIVKKKQISNDIHFSKIPKHKEEPVRVILPQIFWAISFPDSPFFILHPLFAPCRMTVCFYKKISPSLSNDEKIYKDIANPCTMI